MDIKTRDPHYKKEMIWFYASKVDCGSLIATTYIDGEQLDELERSTHGIHQFGKVV